LFYFLLLLSHLPSAIPYQCNDDLDASAQIRTGHLPVKSVIIWANVLY